MLNVNAVTDFLIERLINHKNQVAVLFIKVTGAGLAICLNVSITRSLSLADAGAIFLAISVVTIIYALARMGFGYTISKLIALHNVRLDYSRLKGSAIVSIEAVLISSVIMAALLYIAASQEKGSAYFPGNSAEVLKILALSVPFFCVGSMAGEILKGMRRPAAFSFTDSVLPKLIMAPLIFILAKQYGLYGASWAYVVGIFSTAMISFALAYRVFPVAAKAAAPTLERKSTYSSALYFSILSYGTVIGQWATPLIVGYNLSQESSALYFTAYRTSAVVEFILLSAAAVLGPIFIKTFENQGRNALFGMTYKASLATFFSAGLVAVPMIVLAPWIMQMYGQTFQMATPVLRILVAAQWIAAPAGVFLFTLIALDKERIVAMTTPLAVVIGISIVFLLSKQYGLTGAAIGQALFIILQNVLLAVVAIRINRKV